jgi:adenosylcobinamide-GDP ribazoletransferase
LPYARREEDGKIGTAYRRMVGAAFGVVLVAGFAPTALLLPMSLWVVVAAPLIVFAALAWMMWRRIGGYTGDCCGATFLLCEAAFYVGIWGALSWQ